MDLNVARDWFISKCFNNGQSRAIHLIFGEKYLIENTQVKFTSELYELIASSERVKAVRGEKSANITGRKGMSQTELERDSPRQ